MSTGSRTDTKKPSPASPQPSHTWPLSRTLQLLCFVPLGYSLVHSREIFARTAFFSLQGGVTSCTKWVGTGNANRDSAG